MKTSITLASAAAFFGKLVAADFYIYNVDEYSGVGGYESWTGFRVFPGHPSCDDRCNSYFIPQVDDASGNREGVRCSGCAAGDVQELEVHLNDIHFTLYKGEDFMMTPADGGPLLGQCFKEEDDYYGPCICGPGDSNYGQSFFRCESDISAWDTDYYYG